MKTKKLLVIILLLLTGRVVYAAAPVITSFSPSTGAVGTLVAVRGTNLSGQTVFNIGGKPALVITNNGTKIVGIVMPGAVTGPITLTTAGGSTTTAASFTTTNSGVPSFQNTRLSAPNLLGLSQQGSAVAVSADGLTAVVGGLGDNGNVGATWVYKLRGSNWVLQSGKLIGTGGIGVFAEQGRSVGISADGNTIITGGHMDNTYQGAAWVFTRQPDSTWVQQGPKLVCNDGTRANFGYAVAMSADGNTAAIGGYSDYTGIGASWVFTRIGSTWTQQGSKLVDTGVGGQGYSVALSADGNTLVVGAPNDNGAKGLGLVFARSAGVWAQQAKLVPTGVVDSPEAGTAVAVSADGNTAVITGMHDNNNQGAGWVFTRSGTSWTQFGNKITGTGGVGKTLMGCSVSITADGKTMAMGAYEDNDSRGATFLFALIDNVWKQQGTKLVAIDAISKATQGVAVALSATGSTLLVGGPLYKTYKGSAWAFSAVNPVIASISPVSGPIGTLVTLTGSNMSSATGCSIGGKPAIITSKTATKLTAMVMPGAVRGDVIVSNTSGSNVAPTSFTVIEAGTPNTQQGSRLSANDLTGNSAQGLSVAVSADGKTAIVGGYADNNYLGAAWIYKLAGSNWVTQSNKLLGTGSTGVTVYQGKTVAMSADGNTAIVGGYNNNSGIGAAWVYTRQADSTWAQQGNKIIGTDITGAAGFGYSVAMSADGNTAIIGGYHDNNVGAAWIFTRTGTTWAQQGSKLNGTGAVGNASQGSAVAISADGATAMVSGFNDNGGIGASWIYIKSGTTWAQQGSKLTGTGNTGAAHQGFGIALSADGNTAITGGPNDNTNNGAVWVFTRTGTTWSQFGTKIATPTGATGAPGFGKAVAVSADGKTAAIGGYQDNTNIGATWVYKLTGSSWTQQGNKLAGNDAIGAAMQGISVAMSANGQTIISGGSGHKSGKGAAWVYSVMPSSITAFSPSSGAVGTLVTLRGTNFGEQALVNIGGKPAVIVSKTDTKLVAMVMPGAVSGGITLLSGGATVAASGTFTVAETPVINTQQGNKMAANDAIDRAFQGCSTAISADGITALIGGYSDNNGIGAAWIYKLTNGTWLKTTKLIGTGGIGATRQGLQVALSADGNTAMFTGFTNNKTIGAAWVFIRQTDDSWVQQGSVIPIPCVPSTAYGTEKNMALSADGNTAVIAGFGSATSLAANGGAWILVRNNDAWTIQSTLLPNDAVPITNGNRHISAAISADGNTVAMSLPYDNSHRGAIWFFTRDDVSWTQQGAKLTNATEQYFGYTLALNADATTLVETGSAIGILTRNGNTWSKYGGTINATADAAIGGLGTSLAMSADGKIFVAGGPSSSVKNPNGGVDLQYKGGAWIFKLVNGIWTQQGTALLGAGYIGHGSQPVSQGNSVAMSPNGMSMLSGGYSDNSNIGATWAFYATPLIPVITSFSPSYGPVGTLVTINGTSLNGITAVKIGGKAVLPISNTGTKMVAMVMPGTVNGPVTATAGFIVTTSDDDFTLTNPTAPIAQQGNKITADDATYYANQGSAVALSADGNTALIGGNYDSYRRGSTWVYKRSGNSWIKSTKLIGSGAVSMSYQGTSVAISADGNTALIGGLTNSQNTGAFCFFIRQADSTWVQQGPTVANPAGNGHIYAPKGMTLSADGNIAVLAGIGRNSGYTDGTYVYVRNNGIWSQQGNTIFVPGLTTGHQNISTISADGNTMIIGGTDNNGLGAAWVFVRNGTAWDLQGDKLVGTGDGNNSNFGSAVALSADGNTAIIGAGCYCYDNGGVWIFKRTGNNWTQYGNKLWPNGSHNGSFGVSLGVSADGQTIVIGDQMDHSSDYVYGLGATWVFKLVNGVYTQQGGLLLGTGDIEDGNNIPNHGFAVAISANGTEMLTGAFGDNNYTGATWAFTTAPNPPVVTSVTPLSGPVGTLITVNGSNFGEGIILNIGGKPALITSINASSVKAMVMPGTTTGAVTLSSGNDTGAAAGVFTITNPGPPVTQQGAKISVANNYYAQAGYALSLNANGTNAIMGAPFDNNLVGNAFSFLIEVGGSIFTGLLPTPRRTIQHIGTGVAISPDGNAAVAYGLLDNTSVIQFYSYQSGFWNIDGFTIFPPAGNGYSLSMNNAALSADGKTAVINGNKGYPKISTLYVYIKTRGTWSPKIDLLSDINPSLAGKSVVYSAISADGNTIMAGVLDGGVLVFHRVDNIWSQQGNELMGTESIGYCLALSADGNSAIIKGQTGFYNYIRTGNTWAQYGNKIMGPYPFNNTLALTADGKMFVTSGYDDGKYGATYIFRIVNGVWTQQAALVGTGIDEKGYGNLQPYQGSAVAISANGIEMLTGSTGDATGRGAIWAFYAAPVQQTQSISFKQPVALTTNSQAEDVFASASSGLPVEYTTSNPNVAKVENGQLKIIGRGPVTITAMQKGNKEFKPAEPVTRTLFINRDLTPNSLQDITGPIVDPALSPNGDGKNDVLTITNIEMYSDNKLSIINTNGDAVFQATGYNNQSKVFDGTSTIDGKKQKPGTYYYRLEYKDNGVLKSKTGYIVIKY